MRTISANVNGLRAAIRKGLYAPLALPTLLNISHPCEHFFLAS